LGQAKLFGLDQAKLILEGLGPSNRGELVVLTEEDEWHIMHVPFPGIDPSTGVPVPHRPAMKIELFEVAGWCQADYYASFDSCGRSIRLRDVLPQGLPSVLAESKRIIDWRAGRPTLPIDSRAAEAAQPTFRREPATEGPSGPEASAVSAENKALAVTFSMLQRGETPTVSAVAKAAGVNRQYLYECEGFMAFIKANRGDKSRLPRGWKDRKTGDLEAYRNDDD
jgi:hypothetical protein